MREALDLCLSCKGCKSDCPVGVDMATYKAEFLSHYWRGRLRPRSAYAFGLVPWWSRAAALAPGLANFVTQTPGLSWLVKASAGMAPQRKIPRLASQTLRAWFESRNSRSASGAPHTAASVLLFPDTFTNFFQPQTARAAVDVLETAGFRVTLPRRVLCCGRPLYDYGMLRLARSLLRRVLADLRDEIRAGVPVVVLEPSCAAVFRDELRGLFPDDEDARKLSGQTWTLPELLRRHAPDFRPSGLRRPAILQGHCHQRAILNMIDEEEILQDIGLELTIPDSGCCGMAGAFGFERGEHYAVSIRCGERVLLP